MNEQRKLIEESLIAIERLQSRLEASERGKREPIAILSAACRYPGGVESPEGLWRVVRDRVNGVIEVPSTRWDVKAYLDPTPGVPGKMVTARGGFLPDIDLFDPQFFGISPREASSLDPQQRLLLETSYEAMERAGLPAESLVGSNTGVFVGISSVDYSQILRSTPIEEADIYAANGGALNASAGRISFTFGFLGPCAAVDTACSSSLVAVHLACQSLRAGESDIALACGVNAVLEPNGMVLFSQWGLMAADGACKTFDAAADGFVRSEGCGVVVLKRLSDAIAAGDPILAVIRGSAVNSDGRSSGLTVPHGPAQEELVRRALANAGLKPTDIDYVEAHGTGTPIGDPIEVEALNAVLSEGRSADRPLILGSVKTNIGHPESAAGQAGLQKLVMALHNETIPPNRTVHTPNPRIAWADMKVKVADQPIAWRRGDRPRRGGVSGFGFSGTNAHVIVEEAPIRALPVVPAAAKPCLVPLSARTEPALRQLAKSYAERIAADPSLTLQDLSTTLGAGRSHMLRRAVLLADSVSDLERDLRAYASGTLPTGAAESTLRRGEQPKVGFLFTGQGAQYAGMARKLYDSEPVFRAVLDRAQNLLKPYLDRPLLEVMFATGEEATALNETGYTQPAMFTLQYALSELWRSWGVRPAMVAGHSVGEYAAACVAGVFSFDDGLRLIAERGRLMQALPAGGAMAAIFANEQRVADRVALYGDRIAVAAINGPEETVISGEAEAVRELLAQFAADGIDGRPLEVSHAFHSALLDPMLDALERRAGDFIHASPSIALISNLTGAPFASGTRPDPTYWRRHAREPVRFAASVAALRQAGVTALVEIGPHPTLLGLAARAEPNASWRTIASLRRGRDDRAELLRAVRDLYVAGAEIDWAALTAHDGGRRVALPTYPFQREKYWTNVAPAGSRKTSSGAHVLLGERQFSPGSTVSFLSEVSAHSPAFLGDHVVFGEAVMPGTGYVEMALAAGRDLGIKGPISLEQVAIEKQLDLPEGEVRHVHTTMEPDGEGRFRATVRSAKIDPAALTQSWTDHANIIVRAGGSAKTNKSPTVAQARAQCSLNVDTDGFYARLVDMNLPYGPTFRRMVSLTVGDDIALGCLSVPAKAKVGKELVLHPALLDACFHVIGGVMLYGPKADGSNRIFVPVGIDEITVVRPVGDLLWVVAAVQDNVVASKTRTVDLRLETADGELVATISGLRIHEVTAEAFGRTGAKDIKLHALQKAWHAVSKPAEAPNVSDSRYIVLADGNGFAEQISDALKGAGAGASVLRWEDFAGLTSDKQAAQLRPEADGKPTLVIDCGPLAHAPADPVAGVRDAYLRMLAITQTLTSLAPAAGHLLVTRGAHAIVPGDDAALTQAPLIGLSHVLEAENANSIRYRLDLDPSAAPDVRQVLGALGVLRDAEPELAVRFGDLLAPRLEPIKPPTADTETATRQVLRIYERGDLDRLVLEEVGRTAPEAGEVEIEIRAAGLNFRDVLNALGMYPGNAGSIGSECSGVITRVGAGVTRVKPGDEVIALAGESLASHVTVSDGLLVRKPDNITFADAVTLPNTYLTAQLCLDVAKLSPGQTVLVHAASGGVGAAAVRLCKLYGLNVIATAGNPEKRAFARASGASHVFDSRSTSFADDVLRVTDGEGVDLVINSLADDFIAAGMRAVKKGGCFVEIGKKGIWTIEEAAERAPHVRYSVEDLGWNIQKNEAMVRVAFEKVAEQITQGLIGPLPLRTFPLDQAPAAFRYMANARHIGKIVMVPKPVSKALPLRTDGTYLITGGLGGIGLTIADWLVKHGAGELVLLGRRAPNAEQAASIEALRALGAKVSAVPCDIGSPAAVAALWADTLKGKPPLRGIVHAAGALADAPLHDQDEARYDTVAHAKVNGAWNLHEASRHDPLDFFVFCSSTSALMGSAGQANYATANAFLDGLAAHRSLRGLAATSIAWGGWAEVGMAAGLADIHLERWAQAGVGLITPAEGPVAMESAVRAGVPYVTVTSMNIAKVASASRPGLRSLLGGGESTKRKQPEGGGALAALKASGNAAPEERQKLVRDYIQQEAARVIGLSASSLDIDTPLGNIGFDSLMAVQFRNILVSQLPVDVPLKNLLLGASVAELAAEIDRGIADAGGFAAETDEDVEPPTRFYFGAPGRRLFAVSQPSPAKKAVVLCNPWGPEYLRAHRSIRQLAGMLHASGYNTLRFDYFGTGDSDGDATAADLATWEADIIAAIDQAKAISGAAKVSLVGMRLGAAVAASVASRLPEAVDNLLLWDPVISGPDYLVDVNKAARRNQNPIGRARPRPAAQGGGYELLGFPLTARMLEQINAVDVNKLQLLARTKVMASGTPAQYKDLQRALAGRRGAPLPIDYVESVPSWLEFEENVGSVPVKLLQRIAEWLA
ncbi:MAG TPA: SDR family NAD(P)-dependent oxidoreductase [Xanthobacteraceae bacterium]|nr:SDR family NAD(P)-dependent oxidoreductase [Xanthobacteraceae bacterium]